MLGGSNHGGRSFAGAYLESMDRAIPPEDAFSHVDAAWLRLDPDYVFAITSVLTFEGHVPFHALECVIRERLLREPRFQQRIRDAELPLVMPYWETDPAFDLSLHLHHLRLPLPSGRAELADWLGKLVSTPLARDRPPWLAYVLDDVEGNTVLVARVHHCVADGVSLVRVLRSLCDEAQNAPAQVGVLPGPPSAGGHLQLGRLPAQTKVAAEILALPDDPHTLLRGKLGHRKAVAWSKPLPVADAKRVAATFDGKVNDVLQACVAGSLRRYLLDRQALPRAKEVRTLVPVYFQNEDEHGLGNHFAIVYLSLPILLEDSLERAREVKQRMDVLKHSESATVGFATLDAFGLAGSQLAHVGNAVLAGKASLLTTNVPGPPGRVTIAGHPVTSMVVWAPPGPNVGTAFTLVSYAGGVRLGVSVDRQWLPDPEQLVSAFEDEFAELCARTLATR